jgi:hypothetical protein
MHCDKSTQFLILTRVKAILNLFIFRLETLQLAVHAYEYSLSTHPSPIRHNSRGKASTNASRVRNGPIQIRSNVELRHRFRFVSTNGASTSITPTSLLCSAGTMCTVVNSVVTSFYGSVKVNQIEMWSPPASQGSSTTCSVDWIGSAYQPNREYSDTSVSVATPAYLKCSPPPMSLAGFWQAPSTNTLFNLVAPVGTIVDVHLSLILNDDDESFASATVAGAALGQVYYLSLDPNATHHYPPVSLTTTI